MMPVSYTRWQDLAGRPYLYRMATCTLIFWAMFLSQQMFAIGLERSRVDFLMYLVAFGAYALCVGLVALTFRTKSLVAFVATAISTTMALRTIALLPSFALVSPGTIVEAAAVSAALALLSAVFAFLATSFLFRNQELKPSPKRKKSRPPPYY